VTSSFCRHKHLRAKQEVLGRIPKVFAFKGCVNVLKPTGNFTYRKVHNIKKILDCDHMEFVRFVWISEQTANFALTKQ